MVRALGVRAAWAYLWRVKVRPKLPIAAPGPTVRLRVPKLKQPLLARSGSSDLTVFWQVFIRRDYEASVVSEAQVIVDCGANVGYTTVFFALRHPQAAVYAIEPDPGNFALLEQNAGRLRGRVQLLQAAVWPEPTRLRLVAASEQAQHWATSVEAVSCEDGERNSVMVDTIGIDQLMARYDIQQIDLLKVDIEGAELELFSTRPERWIGRVRCIAAECHGPEALNAFKAAATSAGMTIQPLGHSTWLASRSEASESLIST